MGVNAISTSCDPGSRGPVFFQGAGASADWLRKLIADIIYLPYGMHLLGLKQLPSSRLMPC